MNMSELSSVNGIGNAPIGRAEPGVRPVRPVEVAVRRDAVHLRDPPAVVGKVPHLAVEDRRSEGEIAHDFGHQAYLGRNRESAEVLHGSELYHRWWDVDKANALREATRSIRNAPVLVTR